MTAVLAINFYYQIIVLADCRVSWQGGPYRPQDNLQKLYPLGPSGIISFSGDVSAAKSVLSEIRDQASNTPLPSSARDIIDDISLWARSAYVRLKNQPYLELMYAACDYGNIGVRAENVTLARNYLALMVSPNFDVDLQDNVVRLGYAQKYPKATLVENRNSMISLGLEPVGLQMQVGVIIGSVAPTLASYAPDKVGGLFIVGIAKVEGVHWRTYKIDPFELKIEGRKFVQYDHSNGRRVPFKSIWDFNPRKPDAGNLVFDTPKLL